jgi:perosamine synthetase
MSFSTERVLDVLRAVLPGDGLKVLHEPEFAGNEWNYVRECIDTGWVSSAGKFVDQFEQRLAQYTGARHAVAVVNGTAALQVALQLAGVRSADEVIIPALTFVATANSVAHCGAVPHFVDSAESNLSMDPQALLAHLSAIVERSGGQCRNRLTGRRLAAIVPMHALGHPADIEGILGVAARFGLPVVEDAAESLGSKVGGRHMGTFGLLGATSFNGNKIITTGGGGAILTADPELARHAKHLTTTAKLPHRWEFFHDEVGFNYRLPNLNAALGCAQLERLPDMLARKRTLARSYRERFAGIPGVAFVDEPPGTESNFWLNAIRVDAADTRERDVLLTALLEAGYQCRPIWTLLHRLPMFEGCPRAPLETATLLERCVIKLPSSATLVKS